MNWNVFIDLSETEVFHSVATTGVNSVVALDGASYHTIFADIYIYSFLFTVL